jgi:hypothetical protein
MEAGKPTFAALIADRRYDQQVARACRGNVQHAKRFFAFAPQFFLAMFKQFARCAAADYLSTQAARGINEAAGLLRDFAAGQISQHDDGKFQAFGAVYGHDADAFGAFFGHRRIARLFPLGSRLQIVHEAAQ